MFKCTLFSFPEILQNKDDLESNTETILTLNEARMCLLKRDRPFSAEMMTPCPKHHLKIQKYWQAQHRKVFYFTIASKMVNIGCGFR